ncbi:hypothetical protein DINO107042_04750 [Dichelobacter nodosus]|uniref:Hypothetical lipoprotein n=2 Tax=Dichelobacter nodosus TaxID=870 RepID=A5EWY4_DICNV|nr:hypothetical lipoprotein [Dichelobacter nodosus VCS1703A]
MLYLKMMKFKLCFLITLAGCVQSDSISHFQTRSTLRYLGDGFQSEQSGYQYQTGAAPLGFQAVVRGDNMALEIEQPAFIERGQYRPDMCLEPFFYRGRQYYRQVSCHHYEPRSGIRITR